MIEKYDEWMKRLPIYNSKTKYETKIKEIAKYARRGDVEELK